MTAQLCRLFLLLAMLGLAGCGSSIVEPRGGMPLAPSFKQAFEQTSCEAMAPSACPGSYGFTVDGAGTFAAGPPPAGTIRKGSTTASENSALNAAAEAYLASTGSSTSCQVQQSVPGVSDIVRITNNNSHTIDVFDQGLSPNTIGNCVTADSDKAAALTMQVQQLRQKYYPNPFPTS